MVGLHLLPSPGKYAKNQTAGVGTENTLLTLLNGRAVFLEEKKKTEGQGKEESANIYNQWI